ncbi:MAG: hypothetical protein ACJAQ0_000930, partial [Dasania sp.]
DKAKPFALYTINRDSGLLRHTSYGLAMTKLGIATQKILVTRSRNEAFQASSIKVETQAIISRDNIIRQFL